MKATCPFCGEVYDVGEDFSGRKVICAVCENTFRVPGQKNTAPSEPEESEPANPVIAWIRDHRKLLTWAAAGVVILLAALLVGGYYLLPNKWRAINTRADLIYAKLTTEYKVVDEDEVRDICKQRAELEYKAAEKDSKEDIFIAFWCDREVTGFLSAGMEEEQHRNKNDIHDEPYPQELKDREKDFRQHIEKEHPQNKELIKIINNVEKECSPAEEVLLKYRHIRPYILVQLDKKYEKTSDLELQTLARRKLEKALFNCFRTNDEIRYPEDLKALCKSKAMQLVEIIGDNSEQERDFALLILSEKFDREGENGLDKTTMSSFFWLKYTAKKYISNSAYSWRIENLLDSKSDFWKDYYNLAEYGSYRSSY